MAKAIRKRIALTAAVAVVGGLISATPANAAVGSTATSTAATNTVDRAAATKTLSLTVTNTGAHTGGSNDAYTARVLSVPAGTDNNSVEVNDMFQTTIGDLADAATTTVTVGGNNLLAAGGTAMADEAAATIATATVAGTAITVNSRASVAASPTNLNAGDVIVGGLDGNGDADYADAGESDPTGASDDYFNVAGTYTIGVWLDDDGDGVIDAGDEAATYSTVSVTLGGTPAAITLTPATTTASEQVLTALWVYVTDSAGRATVLSGASEEITLTNTATGATSPLVKWGSNLTSATATATSNGGALSLVSLKTYYLASFQATGNGSVKITANFSGSLNPLSTAASTTITIVGSSNATKIAVKKGQKGVTDTADSLYAFPAAVAANGSNTIAANPLTARSISFVVTGTPGSYVPVTIDNDGGTSPTGVLATGYTTKTTPTLIGADGTAEVTVAATSVAATNKYAISVPISGGTLKYVVVYNAASLQAASITIDQLPSGVTKIVTPAASTTAFKVTVADEYNDRYSGYTVRLTTSSTSRNASKLVDALTSTTGEATVSLTDAGTTGTDSVTIAVYAPNDTITNIKSSGNTATITYAANIGGSFSTTGGDTALDPFDVWVGAAGTVATSAGNLGTTDKALVTITHVLRDANLAPVTGYAARFTGSEGVKFMTGGGELDDAYDSLYVHADGTTSLYAVATKAGKNTVTITAGGYTNTVTFTAYTDAAFSRTVSLADASPATAAPGSGVNFVATVADGFGNIISNATVNFTVVNGRSLSGASAASVPTGVDGKASLSVTADAAATVTVTATISGGQTTSAAGVPVATFAAPVASATKTGKIEGVSQADAAKAEAAKATAAVAALSSTVAGIQTAIAALVASTTATLTMLNNKINKIMKRFKIK